MSSQESAAVNTQDVAARVGELTAQDWIEWLDSEQASVLGTEPDSLDGLFSPVDGETGAPVVNCFHYSRLGLLMMVTPREYFAPICAQVDPEA